MGLTRNREHGGLRLVEAEAPPIASLSEPRWPIELRRAPFRPGELPESLRVDLDPLVAAEAVAKAGRRGVPIALWVRIAVEAGRARDVLAATMALSSAQIDELLLSAGDRDLEPAGLSALERYGAAVLSGGAGDARELGPTLELLVPSEMVLAWRRAAASSEQSLDRWVARMIAAAAPEVEKLEARAAAAGEALAAWCYATFVAAAARPSASDQPRT